MVEGKTGRQIFGSAPYLVSVLSSLHFCSLPLLLHLLWTLAQKHPEVRRDMDQLRLQVQTAAGCGLAVTCRSLSDYLTSE